MKQFLVFSYSEYYPSGGLGDVTGDFDTAEEAIAFAKTVGGDYRHVWDRINDLDVWDWEDWCDEQRALGLPCPATFELSQELLELLGWVPRPIDENTVVLQCKSLFSPIRLSDELLADSKVFQRCSN